MSTDVDKLIESIRTLAPEDRRRVRDALDEHFAAPSPSPAGTEDEFKRRLVEAGLLREITPPVNNLEPYQGRRPFEFEGKPLSETIIEERR